MSGRGFIALAFGLVGAGLVIGVAIGRSGAPEQAAAPPVAPVPQSAGPSRFGGQHLTDTTPGAASQQQRPAVWPAAAQQQQLPPPNANAGKLPARPTVGLPDSGILDASPPLPEAGVMPFDAGIPLPDASLPPQPEPQVAAPPPDPNLVRQGRSFKDANITGSSFDDEDVSEYSVVPDRVVVPDREVTRSSFDDQDLENDHPTGP